MSLVRDMQLARRAKAAGANYSLRIVLEARRAQVPVSLAFGLVDVETGGTFDNIFGHDKGAWRPRDGWVTKAAVAELLRRVAAGEPSNGVGLTQLTWPGFIRAADRAGGAHKPKWQLRVGLDHLAKCVHTFGTRRGLSVYNTGRPESMDGRRYASKVVQRADHWHTVLS